jgi:hypothetical protein
MYSLFLCIFLSFFILILWTYRIKGILFSTKTVSKTNSPLICLSVIYIQESLQRWEKDLFADTEKISGLNSISMQKLLFLGTTF